MQPACATPVCSKRDTRLSGGSPRLGIQLVYLHVGNSCYSACIPAFGDNIFVNSAIGKLCVPKSLKAFMCGKFRDKKHHN